MVKLGTAVFVVINATSVMHQGERLSVNANCYRSFLQSCLQMVRRILSHVLVSLVSNASFRLAIILTTNAVNAVPNFSQS